MREDNPKDWTGWAWAWRHIAASHPRVSHPDSCKANGRAMNPSLDNPDQEACLPGGPQSGSWVLWSGVQLPPQELPLLYLSHD